MIVNKPYTNKEYADLAVYCNDNGMIIEDKGGYLESVLPPEPTVEELKQARISELQQYLSETDWYAIRESETGVDIPAEVKKARADARAEISSLRDEEATVVEPEPAIEEPVVELSEASEDVVELYSMEI